MLEPAGLVGMAWASGARTPSSPSLFTRSSSSFTDPHSAELRLSSRAPAPGIAPYNPPHFTNEAVEAFRLSRGDIPSEEIQSRAVGRDSPGSLCPYHDLR